MKHWLKRLWSRIRGEKMYTHDKESLRHKFNRIRTTAYTYKDQEVMISGSGEKGSWAWPQEVQERLRDEEEAA